MRKILLIALLYLLPGLMWGIVEPLVEYDGNCEPITCWADSCVEPNPCSRAGAFLSRLPGRVFAWPLVLGLGWLVLTDVQFAAGGLATVLGLLLSFSIYRRVTRKGNNQVPMVRD